MIARGFLEGLFKPLAPQEARCLRGPTPEPPRYARRRASGARPFQQPVSALVSGLACLSLVAASQVARAAEVEPRAVFPRRAPIEALAADAALARVTLPAEVLADVRADLADLRVIDQHGRFVPFALTPAADPQAIELITRSSPVRLGGVDRETDDEGHPRRERLELDVQPAGFAFDRVVFALAPGELVVARVSVWDTSDRATPRELAHEAPLFRLPRRPGSAGSDAQMATIAVQPSHAARLVIDIRIEQGGWIAPAEVTLERSDAIETETGEVEMRVLATRSDDSTTELDLERPAAIRPTELRFLTSRRAFVREVRVRDVGGNPLGRGVIARAPGSSIESLDVKLERCACVAGDLYVEIDDAGEGALGDLRVLARVPLPSVVLAPTPGLGAHLYWGGGRVTLPSHRALESFRSIAPSPSAGDASAERALPPARWWAGLPSARLGAAESNPLHRVEPAMAFAWRAGAPLDTSAWSHERALVVGPTPEGLAEWTLGARDLGIARGDLADVRIVDSESRQIAYLFDDPRAAVELPATAERVTARAIPRVSRFRLAVPDGTVPVVAIEIQFQDGFFARDARVLEVRSQHGDRLLASTRLERRTAGTPFRIALAGTPRVANLVLEIVDGDDPPLTPTSATLVLASRRVLFAAQPGRYRALLGNREASKPKYELASARELAVGLPTAEAEAGSLDPNPGYRQPSALATRSGRTVALWVALAVSVLALVALTLKLVREPNDSASSGRG